MSDFPHRIQVASYNIHRCIGSDGRFDAERTIAVIAQLEADIIALQELETSDDGGLNLLAHFRNEIGMFAIAGPTVFRHDSHYGNALLCRQEPRDIRLLDISVPHREPRGAICCKLECGKRTVSVTATHFGLLPSERRHQAELLLSTMQHDQGDISILMGDINEWFMWGRPLRRLQRHFNTKGSSPRTFPARFPLFALDRIWIEPGIHLEQISVEDTSLARQASDHLPLKAQLRL